MKMIRAIGNAIGFLCFCFTVIIFAALTVAVLAQGVVGIPPAQQGPALQDGTWLQGIVNGYNRSFVSGLTATASGTQANALVLPANVMIIEVDTVATNGDSVMLPQCVASRVLTIINAGAATLSVYGNNTTNRATGAADTINGTAGSTAYSLTTLLVANFICAKNGAWKVLKSA